MRRSRCDQFTTVDEIRSAFGTIRETLSPAHDGRAHVDRDHVAFGVADLHAVANLHGTLDEGDQPRDEVRREVLQAEADAEREQPEDEPERGEVEPDHLQADDGTERNHAVLDGAHERVADALVQLGCGGAGAARCRGRGGARRSP